MLRTVSCNAGDFSRSIDMFVGRRAGSANSNCTRADQVGKILAHWFFFQVGIAPRPTLHILAMEAPTFGYAYDEPKLWNVIDLGEGRAGVIVTIASGENIETDLFEYHDGTDLKHMSLLQSIAAGE